MQEMCIRDSRGNFHQPRRAEIRRFIPALKNSAALTDQRRIRQDNRIGYGKRCILHGGKAAAVQLIRDPIGKRFGRAGKGFIRRERRPEKIPHGIAGIPHT